MSPTIIIKKRKIFFATTWRPHISSPLIKIKIKMNLLATAWRPRSRRHFLNKKKRKKRQLATNWRLICSSPFHRHFDFQFGDLFVPRLFVAPGDQSVPSLFFHRYFDSYLYCLVILFFTSTFFQMIYIKSI